MEIADDKKQEPLDSEDKIEITMEIVGDQKTLGSEEEVKITKVIASELKIEPKIESWKRDLNKVVPGDLKKGPVDPDAEMTLEINNNQKNKFKKVDKILKGDIRKEIEVLNDVQFIKQLPIHLRESLEKR